MSQRFCIIRNTWIAITPFLQEIKDLPQTLFRNVVFLCVMHAKNIIEVYNIIFLAW